MFYNPKYGLRKSKFGLSSVLLGLAFLSGSLTTNAEVQPTVDTISVYTHDLTELSKGQQSQILSGLPNVENLDCGDTVHLVFRSNDSNDLVSISTNHINASTSSMTDSKESLIEFSEVVQKPTAVIEKAASQMVGRLPDTGSKEFLAGNLIGFIALGGSLFLIYRHRKTAKMMVLLLGLAGLGTLSAQAATSLSGQSVVNKQSFSVPSYENYSYVGYWIEDGPCDISNLINLNSNDDKVFIDTPLVEIDDVVKSNIAEDNKDRSGLTSSVVNKDRSSNDHMIKDHVSSTILTTDKSMANVSENNADFDGIHSLSNTLILDVEDVVTDVAEPMVAVPNDYPTIKKSEAVMATIEKIIERETVKEVPVEVVREVEKVVEVEKIVEVEVEKIVEVEKEVIREVPVEVEKTVEVEVVREVPVEVEKIVEREVVREVPVEVEKEVVVNKRIETVDIKTPRNFEIRIVEVEDLPYGEYRIKQQGQIGMTIKTVGRTFIDDVQQGEDELLETSETAPVEMIIEVGKKPVEDTYTDHRDTRTVTRTIRHETEDGADITLLVTNNGLGNNEVSTQRSEAVVTWRTNDRTNEVSNVEVLGTSSRDVNIDGFGTVSKDGFEYRLTGEVRTTQPIVPTGSSFKVNATMNGSEVAYTVNDQPLTFDMIVETFIWKKIDVPPMSAEDTYTDHRESKETRLVLRHIDEDGRDITDFINANAPKPQNDGKLSSSTVTFRTNDRTGEVSDVDVVSTGGSFVEEWAFFEHENMIYTRNIDDARNEVGKDYHVTSEVLSDGTVVFKTGGQPYVETVTEIRVWSKQDKELIAPPTVEESEVPYIEHMETRRVRREIRHFEPSDDTNFEVGSDAEGQPIYNLVHTGVVPDIANEITDGVLTIESLNHDDLVATSGLDAEITVSYKVDKKRVENMIL